MTEQAAETIGGRYHVVETLGKGAMGVVYRAHDPVLDRVVAIKRMTSEIARDPALRQRFYIEARAAARLNHPHIVTIYELGEVDQDVFIVMELLVGMALADMIRQKVTLPVPAVADLMAQVCDGLDFAHRNGIVHRDIKPGNLHVAPNGTLKILDFGIARFGSVHMTASGMLVGTPDYMAPEQARGAEIDGRADLFSVGAVLYELLSGVKPFAGGSLAAVLTRLIREPHRPIRDLAPQVPARLSALIDQLLAKDRTQRPASAGGVRDELSAIAEQLRAPGTRVGASMPEVTLAKTLVGRAEDQAAAGHAAPQSPGAAESEATVVPGESPRSASPAATDVAPPRAQDARAPVAADVPPPPRNVPQPAPPAATPIAAVLPVSGRSAGTKRGSRHLVAVATLALVALAGAAGAYWWWQQRPVVPTTAGTAASRGSAQPGEAADAGAPGQPAQPVPPSAQADAAGAPTVPSQSRVPSTEPAQAGGDVPAVPTVAATAAQVPPTASVPAETGARRAPAGAGATAPARKPITPADVSRQGRVTEPSKGDVSPRVADDARLEAKSKTTLTGDTISVLTGRGAGDVESLARSGALVAAENRVRYVLDQYAQAFARHDVETLRSLRAPVTPAEAAWADSAASITVRLDEVQVDVTETSGTARLRRVVEGTLGSGAAVRESRLVTLQLVRRPTGWIITEIR